MLDDLDSARLKELQSNARQSFRELAEKFEASAVIVAERVRKMEKQGIIEGYSAILNHEKLGYGITTVTEVTVSKGSQEPYQSTSKSWEEGYLTSRRYTTEYRA